MTAGADLGAVLSEAQLNAVHELLDRKKKATTSHTEDAVAADATHREEASVVTMAHLRRAMQETRSSLPAGERRRLEAIYARFKQQRDPSVGNRIHHEEGRGFDTGGTGGKRSTLA